MRNYYSHIDVSGKVNSIQANLDERYKEFFCIAQELLQNADDAKATQIVIGQLEKLSEKHELFDIPGIFVINNGPASPSDIQHIFSIANSNKGEDAGKIGKFGLGMKSVFHLCESFFIFGYQDSWESEKEIVEFFDPWDDNGKLDNLPDPHPQWRTEFDKNKFALWTDVNAVLSNFFDWGTDWFALWLPLRQRNQCTNSGELMDYYPLEDNAKEWFSEKDLRKISGMMPFFKHLRKISFVSGWLEKFGTLELLPDNNSSFTGKSQNEWSGSIVSDKNILGRQSYHGWEYFGNNELTQLQQSDKWPTVRVYSKSERRQTVQKDKTSPHVAICYCVEKLPEEAVVGKLFLQECVFLPLSEMCPPGIDLPLLSNITVSFHGQYFVDAGRRAYKLEDDKSVDSIKVQWNKLLRSEMLLPEILPTFYNFSAQFDIKEIATVLESFKTSKFWQDNSGGICRDFQFMLCLTHDGWAWKLENADKKFICLPDVNRPELLRKIYDLVGKDCLIVQKNAPYIGTSSETTWKTEQICRVWEAATTLDEKKTL